MPSPFGEPPQYVIMNVQMGDELVHIDYAMPEQLRLPRMAKYRRLTFNPNLNPDALPLIEQLDDVLCQIINEVEGSAPPDGEE